MEIIIGFLSVFKMPQQTQVASSPIWLTQEYMQDKLRIRYNDPNLMVTDFKIKPASSKGDNYTSQMLRIHVSYRGGTNIQIQEESLIVKSTFSGDNLQVRIMNAYGFYDREMRMYEEILPKLSEILEASGDNTKIFPKTIYVDYDHASIIFEDLGESNFKMADRLERLDIEHAQIALEKLAKFHAAAAVLHERDPNVFANNFDRGLFNRKTQGFKPMVIGILSALLRYIDTQDQLKQRYYKKLDALKDRIMEYCERAFDVNPQHFMTLTHGDYWHTNMMFKYDVEDSSNKPVREPIDQCPLDFQCSSWASPAIDLHYFFNTSLREELRLHQQPALIQYYYKILTKTLSELHFKGVIPSLFEFRIQVELRSFYGFFAAFIFQPIMICPDTEDADFMNLISDTESGLRFKNTLFKNVKVQKNLERLLPIFDQMGVLDNMDSQSAGL